MDFLKRFKSSNKSTTNHHTNTNVYISDPKDFRHLKTISASEGMRIIEDLDGISKPPPPVHRTSVIIIAPTPADAEAEVDDEPDDDDRWTNSEPDVENTADFEEPYFDDGESEIYTYIDDFRASRDSTSSPPPLSRSASMGSLWSTHSSFLHPNSVRPVPPRTSPPSQPPKSLQPPLSNSGRFRKNERSPKNIPKNIKVPRIIEDRPITLPRRASLDCLNQPSTSRDQSFKNQSIFSQGSPVKLPIFNNFPSQSQLKNHAISKEDTIRLPMFKETPKIDENPLKTPKIFSQDQRFPIAQKDFLRQVSNENEANECQRQQKIPSESPVRLPMFKEAPAKKTLKIEKMFSQDPVPLPMFKDNMNVTHIKDQRIFSQEPTKSSNSAADRNEPQTPGLKSDPPKSPVVSELISRFQQEKPPLPPKNPSISGQKPNFSQNERRSMPNFGAKISEKPQIPQKPTNLSRFSSMDSENYLICRKNQLQNRESAPVFKPVIAKKPTNLLSSPTSQRPMPSPSPSIGSIQNELEEKLRLRRLNLNKDS